MIEDDDEFSNQASKARALLQAMQRSVRSSIARSYRLDQSDSFTSAHDFVDRHEGRIQYFGLDLGAAGISARRAEMALVADGLGPTTNHFRALVAVLWHINESASTVWRPNRRAGNTLDVLLEIHAQSVLVAEEAYMLLEAGHPVAAQVRWRTLYELESVIRVVAMSSDRAARIYKVSHIAEEYRSQRKFERFFTDDDSLLKHRAAVESKYKRLLKRYDPRVLNPFGWSAEWFPASKTRFTVNDIIETAQTKVDPKSFYLLDYISYIRASQHGHGVRSSSTTVLSTYRSPRGKVFVPAGGDLGLIADKISRSAMRITEVLQHFTFKLFGNEESYYWTEIADAVALDVSTEAYRSHIFIEPSYFANMSSVVPGGRSALARAKSEAQR